MPDWRVDHEEGRMTVEPNFGRTWEYRFYDERGLITLDRFPKSVDVSYGADGDAWRAAALFQTDHKVTVTRIERYEPVTGEWKDVPKP